MSLNYGPDDTPPCQGLLVKLSLCRPDFTRSGSAENQLLAAVSMMSLARGLRHSNNNRWLLLTPRWKTLRAAKRYPGSEHQLGRHAGPERQEVHFRSPRATALQSEKRQIRPRTDRSVKSPEPVCLFRAGT